MKILFLFGAVFGAQNFCSIQNENFTEIIFSQAMDCDSQCEIGGISPTQTDPPKKEPVKQEQVPKKLTAKIQKESPTEKQPVKSAKKAKGKEKLDLTTPGARKGLILAYRKKTCQQVYYNREIPADMRKMTLEKLECQKINYKNFDPKKDRYLQADASEGMKKLTAKFGDSKKM